MSENNGWQRHKFGSPLSGTALLKLMREHKVKLTDISINSEHIQRFEDWEEDRIVVSFKTPSHHSQEA